MKYPTSDHIYAGGEDWEDVAPNQPFKSKGTSQRNNQRVIYEAIKSSLTLNLLIYLSDL